MRLSTFNRLAIGAVSLSTVCCAEPERTVVTVPWTVRVETERGAGLPGAEIFFNEKHVGTTGSDGRLTKMISGSQGDPTRVTHDCPPGYRAQDETTIVRLRRYQPTDVPKIMEVALTCRNEMRTAAFVVRAAGASHLPVSLNGEVVAKTNAAGVAHFSRADAPGTEYLVELDARTVPEMRPSHTTHRFVLGEDHELFVVDQAFERAPKRRKPRPRPHRIVKIE